MSETTSTGLFPSLSGCVRSNWSDRINAKLKLLYGNFVKKAVDQNRFALEHLWHYPQGNHKHPLATLLVYSQDLGPTKQARKHYHTSTYSAA